MTDNNLRDQAEESLKKKSIRDGNALTPESIAAMAPDQISAILHELQVHQIELELQNEELRKVQYALDLSRAVHVDFFDFAPTGYVTLSNRGLIQRTNLWFSTQVGIERRPLIGTLWSALILRDDHSIWYSAQANLLKEATPIECHLRLLKGDGNLFWAHLSGCINKSGQIAVVIVDISKLKEIESQLAQAKLAAEAANIAKSEFLANMSHEIRTPLSAMLGYTEILAQSTELSSGAQTTVESLKRNLNHLTHVVNDILDLSKIEAGKMDVERVDLDFLTTLSQVFEPLTLQAQLKGLALGVHFVGEIPKTIWTNAGRLRQILLNIVGNAIKFTERGAVRVTIGLNAKVPGKTRSLVFSVQDTGCGMDANQRQALFKPFSQVDSSVTRKYGGTGLGLTISRRLAELLGGTVEIIDSSPGHGSTFGITIDPGSMDGVIMRTGLTPADLKSAHEVSRDRPLPSDILAGLKVLLAEDVDDLLELVSLFLSNRGAVVTPANNGAEAVALALSHDYDIVLMDMQMPVLDGYGATKQLRAQGYKKPIVALTAHALSSDRDKCLAAGCTEFICKPVVSAALVAKIAKITGRDGRG
jgi:signal transduction histidine kinase/CheY-like chemotaxis protein